ncbi:MAG TPA: hypothetical protein ENG51_20095 [Deltaproteobacteria bacterium]|nr:MAG: hypothetical protein DRG59_08340 [Deltaproteobacteria bacterium]HDM78737.1 hypothetical protein [Deltaproteobacteria bacterium]
MLNINITLFIQIANVLILLYILNKILYRPIRTIIKKRKETIDDFTKRIEGLDGEVQAALEKFQAELREARRAGRQKVQVLKEEAFKEEKTLLDEAKKEAERLIASIREKIKEEIGQAREQLRGQIQIFSLQLAEKILGRSVK